MIFRPGRPSAAPPTRRAVLLTLLLALTTVAPIAISTFTGQSQRAAALQETAPAGFVKPSGPLSPRLTALAAGPLPATLRLPTSGPASLTWHDDRLLTYIHGSTNQATLDQLTAAGAQIRHVSSRYGIVTAAIAPANLRTVAEVPSVVQMQEAITPGTLSNSTQTEKALTPQPPLPQPWERGRWITTHGGVLDKQQTPPAHVNVSQTQTAFSCPGGAVVSEGVSIIKADQARAQFSVDGSGITVGVLANSFDVETVTQINAAEDIASGDLPGPTNPCGYATPVRVLAEARLRSGNDEGRGVLQVIHDVAPGAELAFATAADGLFAFADNIRRLQTDAGADVLIDDFFYVEEPFFQDGPINVAIRDVTRNGALYVTAGGNINLTDQDGNPIGAYEAPAYRPTICPTITDNGASSVPVKDCHDFDPNDGTDNDLALTLPPNGRVVVNQQWSEPWFGVGTDFDIYLIDAQNAVVAKSENPLGFAPFEALSYDNTSADEQQVRLVVVRFTGDNTPRFKATFGSAALNRPGISALEYAGTDSIDRFGPTMTDHSSAADAITVGAVSVEQPDQVEPFSSRGPATIDWRPAVSIRPAKPLAEPEVRAKPDILAPNGVRTTFLGRANLGTPRCDPADPNNNVCRFFGTSASAPHVAGVLALMQQRAAQQGYALRANQAARILARTASEVAGPPEARGAGLVDARAAVEAVRTRP